MKTAPRDAEAEVVESYLHAHPGFLAARPQLYALLAPPVRVHGEVLADHMAAMIQAGRDEWRALLEAQRIRAAFAARAGEAVLALIAARDALDCVRDEWPARLGLESCRLIASVSGAPLILRDVEQASASLHGEAAPLIAREALLHAGDHTLVLGARNAADLPNEPATLAFLARALQAALAR
ncbi:hypothetical protein [Roseococcus sp. YIM B11640]|uniref:hypothetical protein n=1 Tax=Roseococcus sp. YIM B11640 TaxID=3133973 RepID=UPI003C7CD19E